MEREIKRNRQGRILSYEIVNSTDTYGVIALEKNVKLFTSQSFYINQSTEITELEIEAPAIIGYGFNTTTFTNNNTSQNNPTTTQGSIGSGNIEFI
jgi:hypothetical protein